MRLAAPAQKPPRTSRCRLQPEDARRESAADSADRSPREEPAARGYWRRTRKPAIRIAIAATRARKSRRFRNRQRGENKDIEQIGKKQIPLEDRDNAHGDERIDHKEEVMIHLQPVRRRTSGGVAARRPAGKWMVDGPQIQRDHESRKAGCKGDQHQPGFGVAVRRGGFVIEEALKKMTQQVRKLAALRAGHWPSAACAFNESTSGSDIMKSRWNSSRMGNLHHLDDLLARCSACPAAGRVAQRRFPDWAGSSSFVSSEGGASARMLPFAITITRLQTCSTTSSTCEM